VAGQAQQQQVTAGVEAHPMDPRRLLGPHQRGAMQWALMEHVDERRARRFMLAAAASVIVAVIGAAWWSVRQAPQQHELLQQAWALVEADSQLTSGQKIDLHALMDEKNNVRMPWQLFRREVVHDPSLVPAAPPPPLPDGTLRRWDETAANRAEFWAWLLEAEPSLGIGQLHVEGRLAQAPPVALGQRTEDGRFIIRVGQPSMSREMVADAETATQVDKAATAGKAHHTSAAAAAATSAASIPATTAAVAPLSALPPSVASTLSAFHKDWSLTKLELIFPHAKPQPFAYMWDSTTGKFLPRVGAASCPPADILGSSEHPGVAYEVRRVLRQLKGWSWWCWPDWWLPKMAWAGLALGGVLALLPRPHHPTQHRFAGQFVRAMRDTPSVRQFFGLPATGLRLDRRQGEVVFEATLFSSELEGKLTGTRWAHLLVGPEWLRQAYMIKTPSSSNGHHPAVGASNNGYLVVIAQKQTWAALGGALHWGTWRVDSVLCADAKQQRTIELKRKDGKEIFAQ
jgi:hypothetical protein